MHSYVYVFKWNLSLYSVSIFYITIISSNNEGVAYVFESKRDYTSYLAGLCNGSSVITLFTLTTSLEWFLR